MIATKSLFRSTWLINVSSSSIKRRAARIGGRPKDGCISPAEARQQLEKLADSQRGYFPTNQLINIAPAYCFANT